MPRDGVWQLHADETAIASVGVPSKIRSNGCGCRHSDRLSIDPHCGESTV